MLDPDEIFPISTITRRDIACEINNYLDADHQIESNDHRLTKDICREWAASVNARDFLDEDEDEEANMILAVNTAAEIGLGDYVEKEWREFIETSEDVIQRELANRVWYEITGVRKDGRRFRPIVTVNEIHARAFNIWKGTLWKCTNNGRVRIHTWSNQ